MNLTLRRRRYPITAVMAWLLMVFLVLFPKGGVKVGVVPLTWGYMLLGLSMVPALPVRLLAMPLRFRLPTLTAAASVLPFLVVFVYSCVANGIDFPGVAVSDVACFLILPLAFLIVYPAFFPRIEGVRLARLFCFCIVATALIGIFLFIYYRITTHLIEIPYLTVNAGDAGEVANTKHIGRGLYIKLISTYNNGNIYGVCILMLLPLFDRLEPKQWKRNSVRLALLLTLSRTVWFGLIMEQALSLLHVALDAAATFPRVIPGPAVRRTLLIGGTFVGVLAALTLSSGTLAFLFDSGLGGRTQSVASLSTVTWLPSVGVNAFVEILYTSALFSYGIVGLLSILLIFGLPVVLFLHDRHRILASPLRFAAFKGLILYMIVSVSDCAINLIPVMAFYWFIYAVFLEGWPGNLPAGWTGQPAEQMIPAAELVEARQIA